IVATCGLTNLAVRGALFSHDWHSAAKVGAINSITQNSADDFIRLFDEVKANPAKWNAVDVELRLKLERFYEYVKGAKAQAAIVQAARAEFDAYGSEWLKINPHTGKEMFNVETGGYVVCHAQHNSQYLHEFTMAESFAKDGKRVLLLSENAPVGVATPDAEIIGVGVFDFKNINSTNPLNIERNIHDYVLNAKSQAENIAFNIANNPVVTIEMVNKAVKEAIETAKAAGLNNLANHVGIVYKDGTTKIIDLKNFDIENGIKF
ncbi:MAG: hypothetical protein IM638_19895, partial [Bacteroidetes bacterium]|nr:hypothetical protein [Bacteroidota bacterium]